MTATTPRPPGPPSPAAHSGFAVPAKLIVFFTFMTQFIALLLGLGGLLPYLHERGVNTIILAVGAIGAFALLQTTLSFVLKRIPVRCLDCRGRARFTGFGWWPFIYRFTCGTCGVQRRIEVSGR